MKIEVRLSKEVFLRFGMFHVLRLRKAWRSPALFAAILCVCAAVCFLMRHIQGAAVLGAVLLLAGIGIPAAYFLSFYLSLRKQVSEKGLTQPKYVYTLELHDDESGITVDNRREHAAYQWKQVFHVYRDKTATYLYITPQRAFLIPHDCVAEGPDRLWELIARRVPKDRCTN